jgi:hypothetical protein
MIRENINRGKDSLLKRKVRVKRVEGRWKKTDDRKTDKIKTGQVGEVKRQLSRKRERQRKDRRRRTWRQDKEVTDVWKHVQKTERKKGGKKEKKVS